MDNQQEKPGETGFYVEPKTDCPHIKELKRDQNLMQNVAANAPCTDCQHKEENWACLTCGKRFCSRYVKGHMAKHNTDTKHPIAVSYSDFSFWCYSCDSYITSPAFAPLLKLMSAAKFGDAGTGGRYTAHANLQQMEEHFDSPEELQKKVKELAKYVKESKHMIAFTGAGISTSCGIPDYRGPQGEWTLRAQGKERKTKPTSTLCAIPSPCHRALVKLQDEGILKYLISQNVDGLHRRSGIDPNKLSELHGNDNLELCEKCGKEYMRDFSCQRGANVHHLTGRSCTQPGCDGMLVDSIINFGENLPLHVTLKGFENSEKADLCIAVGSSLTVTPAADMPKKVGKNSNGRLVIINLQRTPLDKLASLRIFARSDEVFEMLMKELKMDIPPFVLKRRVLIRHTKAGKMSVDGVDSDGTPLSLFIGVECKYADGASEEIDLAEAPFVFKKKDEKPVEFKLHFQGHYNESPLIIKYTPTGEEGAKKFLLELDIQTGKWNTKEVPVEEEQKIDTHFASQCPNKLKDHHHDHDLTLVPKVYDGNYRCNICLKTGSGWVYTCAGCNFDAHLTCCLWRRPK